MSSRIVYTSTQPSTTNTPFTLYNGSSAQIVGQSVYIDTPVLTDAVYFLLRKLGSPTGDLIVSIYNTTGTPGSNAVPVGSPLKTFIYDVALLPEAAAPLGLWGLTYIHQFTAPGNYFFTVSYQGGNSSNALNVYSPGGDFNPTQNTAIYNGNWIALTSNDFPITVTAFEATYKDQSGVARIVSGPTSMPANAIVGGWGSSTVGGQAAAEAIRASLTVTSRDQPGVARIQITTQKAQAGIARIQKTVTQAQTGVASILSPFVSTSRTQTGVASIRKTILRTQTGRASIRKTLTVVQTGTARIEITSKADQTGTARISQTFTQNINGTAWIEKLISQPQTGVAAIIITFAKDQAGVARIGDAYPVNPADSEGNYRYGYTDTGVIQAAQNQGEGNYRYHVDPTDEYGFSVIDSGEDYGI